MNHKANAVLHSIVCLLLLTSVSVAQELGAQFKKIKDGIFTYVGTSGESNCTIILTQDGVVLIDSGNFPKDSYAVRCGQEAHVPAGASADQHRAARRPYHRTFRVLAARRGRRR